MGTIVLHHKMSIIIYHPFKELKKLPLFQYGTLLPNKYNITASGPLNTYFPGLVRNTNLSLSDAHKCNTAANMRSENTAKVSQSTPTQCVGEARK